MGNRLLGWRRDQQLMSVAQQVSVTQPNHVTTSSHNPHNPYNRPIDNTDMSNMYPVLESLYDYDRERGVPSIPRHNHQLLLPHIPNAIENRYADIKSYNPYYHSPAPSAISPPQLPLRPQPQVHHPTPTTITPASRTTAPISSGDVGCSSSSTPPSRRSPPTKKPEKAKQIKKTIFDDCPDASYTRPSGIAWPDDHTDIPTVPYKNKMIYAKVVNVYDGDTITVMILYGGMPMKFKVRIQGVDAPELKVKKDKNRKYSHEELELMELEERAGNHVAEKVRKLLIGKEIIIKLIAPDKYGSRNVGVVYLKPNSYETLTEYLLSKRYGKRYDAGKKEEWSREELEYILNN